MLADILELRYDSRLAEAEARYEAEAEARYEAEYEARHQERLKERLMAEKIAMARNFKNDGVPVEVIARNTGFTIAEIVNL